MQGEYFKAYYAALLERQREQDQDVKRQQDLSNTDISDHHTSSDRQVGMKSKREDEIEDEDVWEEATPSGKCSFILFALINVGMNWALLVISSASILVYIYQIVSECI